MWFLGIETRILQPLKNFFWGPLEPFRKNLPLYSTVFDVLYQNICIANWTQMTFTRCPSCYMCTCTMTLCIYHDTWHKSIYCACIVVTHIHVHVLHVYTHILHMQQCEWDDHLLVSGSVVVWVWPAELGLGALSIFTIVCTALQTHWLDTVIIQIWLTRATIIHVALLHDVDKLIIWLFWGVGL